MLPVEESLWVFLIMDRAACREEPSQPAAQATGWLRAEADARPTSRRPTARSCLRTHSGWASGDRPSSCWPGSRRSQCPFFCHSHTSALQREGGRGLQPISPHPPKALSSSLPLSAFTPSVKQGCTHLPPMTLKPSEAYPVHGQLPRKVAGVPSIKR